MDSKELGQKGEQIAADYLVKNGFKIIDTNWRYGHLEVDIVAENENYLVICEVKARSSVIAGKPEEFVTKQKQKNLITAASKYMMMKKKCKEVRFDIISVIAKDNSYVINHIPRAFEPNW